MKQIAIVCAGKLKEPYLRDAEQEYVKRLSAYCDLRVIQVRDEGSPEGTPEAEREKLLRTEAGRLQKSIPQDAYVIALVIGKKQSASEQFASHMESLQEQNDRIVFLIGSSYGLHESMLELADEQMSLSAMTFPHQLARIILLEQLYRSFRIRSGAPYHK